MAVGVLRRLLFAVVRVAWVAVDDETCGPRSPATSAARCSSSALLAFAPFYALVRCRVTADVERAEVVNGYRTQSTSGRRCWRCTCRTGAPFATLDLADGTSRQALAIQCVRRRPAPGSPYVSSGCSWPAPRPTSLERPDPPGD